MSENTAIYPNVVRRWFALRLSQQRSVAESLGLPPQGVSNQFDWGKLVLMTAKEAGELPRVALALKAYEDENGEPLRS